LTRGLWKYDSFYRATLG